jgi:hypothetical protein
VALSADLNNGGSPDAVFLTAAGLVLLRNDAKGKLTANLPVQVQGVGALALADFTGNGSRRFSPAESDITAKAPVSPAASDLDGDGTEDLTMADNSGPDEVRPVSKDVTRNPSALRLPKRLPTTTE